MTFSCAIASPHTLATDAAAAAIRDGGTAVDAALAAAITLTVVYPHNTSLGGDLVALVRDPSGRITCINASGPMPAAASATEIASRHGGRMPVTGPDTITVPGAVAGLAALHDAGAARPWAAHFAAAVRHARQTPVVAGLAAAIGEATAQIDHDPGMAAVFSPSGRPLAEGEVLRQEALAASLTTLAAHGPGALYRGPLGARLTAGLRALGSRISDVDLATYAVEVTPPLSRTFDGHDVHTSLPNTQGFLLIQALTALAGAEVDDPLRAGASHLAAVFRHGIRDRDRHLADPRRAAIDLDRLLDPQRLRALPLGGDDPAVADRPNGDTVAVVTADSDGYAVSLIQSLFHSFGAARLEPSTGILLHNRGSYFSLDPASPNVLAPGKRPAHTLMPVMVTAGGALRWVNGTMGGTAQPQIHTQLLLRLLGRVDLTEAVTAPRWVVGGMEAGQSNDTITAEADLDPRASSALAALGAPITTVPPRSELVGHTQVVAVDPDGTLAAASDPRSDGAAIAVER